jgi:hypothetical protein
MIYPPGTEIPDYLKNLPESEWMAAIVAHMPEDVSEDSSEDVSPALSGGE